MLLYMKNIFFKRLTNSYLISIIFLVQGCSTIPQKIQQSANIQNNQLFQAFQQTNESNIIVSVKDFGAIGNNITDDTNAIQKAIDTVDQAGGGTVFFPNGIYIVKINHSKSHAITIRSKVTLRGASNKTSVIKLAAKQGNYSSILAGERPDSDLSDFAMYDLTIDGNSTTNPAEPDPDPKKPTPITRMRYAVRVYVGSRINIERCRFRNLNSRNVITVNGYVAPFKVSVTDVLIKNNIFELIGGGKVDYDHSTIYTHGKRIEIANNYFSSRNGAGTNGARTAIEIHGDEQTVKDNKINGFANGIYITGYASSANHLIVTDNIINDAYWGIMIWSFFSYGNTNYPAISNCVVRKNQIRLNVDGWRRLWGDSASVGIMLEPDSDAPIKNLDIVNNDISVIKFSGRGRVNDNIANGIRLWRDAAANVESENIRILGNKIQNSLAGGIYIFMPIKTGEISNNMIVNPGQSNGNFHDDYRAGMIVDGVFENVKFKKNLLLDNQRHNTLKGGIISSAKCINICEASGNKLQVKSGAKFPIFRNTKNTNFVVSD
ncbi:poly(beta-D-mannuronate) C5 epimerase 2 [Fischerella sp. NIES-4106]|nr:poly(beta-D-mannuronate) C5 epimerase 2 [Fischerella sp. NIES-4106]